MSLRRRGGASDFLPIPRRRKDTIDRRVKDFLSDAEIEQFRELAARRLDFYHKPVKTTRRELTENFGQRPVKDTMAKQYCCPLKWDHLTRLKRHTAQN